MCLQCFCIVWSVLPRGARTRSALQQHDERSSSLQGPPAPHKQGRGLVAELVLLLVAKGVVAALAQAMGWP